MIGKNNIKKQLERRGEKVETYSIKKFKVGVASVLIGVGLFFGAGAVEASDSVTQSREATNSPDEGVNTANIVLENSVKPVANKIENTPAKVAAAVAEKIASQSNDNKKNEVEAEAEVVDDSVLNLKIEELKSQLERVKNNTKQKSLIEEATKKLESAESLLKNNPTKQEVDKKAKDRLLTNRSTACFLTEIKSLKWYNISIQRRF